MGFTREWSLLDSLLAGLFQCPGGLGWDLHSCTGSDPDPRRPRFSAPEGLVGIYTKGVLGNKYGIGGAGFSAPEGLVGIYTTDTPTSTPTITPSFSAPEGLVGIYTEVNFLKSTAGVSGFSAPEGLVGIYTNGDWYEELFISFVSVPRRAWLGFTLVVVGLPLAVTVSRFSAPEGLVGIYT